MIVRGLFLAWLLAGCVAGSDGPAGTGSPHDPEPGLKADLFAGPIAVPDHIRADSILTMTVGVRNGGNRAADAGWVVRVMLSQDRMIDLSDIQLDQFAASRALSAGGEDQYLRHKKLRGGIPSGPYYVGSILDATGAVAEASEANNTLQFPAEITITERVSQAPSGN